MAEHSRDASNLATQPGVAASGTSEIPVSFKTNCPFWNVRAADVGQSHWEARRNQWTNGNLTTTPSTMSDRRHLGKLWKHAGSREVSRSNLEKVYTLCVEERKAFSRPINLAEIIPVLISGWKKNGTWPEGQSAPADST